MSKLIVTPQDGIGSEFPLQDATISIGRKEDNDLVLPDRTVSRHHAKIEYHSKINCFEIHNLSETNPLAINGKVLKKHTILFNQDAINLGSYVLTFVEKEN